MSEYGVKNDEYFLQYCKLQIVYDNVFHELYNYRIKRFFFNYNLLSSILFIFRAIKWIFNLFRTSSSYYATVIPAVWR